MHTIRRIITIFDESIWRLYFYQCLMYVASICVECRTND